MELKQKRRLYFLPVAIERRDPQAETLAGITASREAKKDWTARVAQCSRTAAVYQMEHLNGLPLKTFPIFLFFFHILLLACLDNFSRILADFSEFVRKSLYGDLGINTISIADFFCIILIKIRRHSPQSASTREI